MATLVFVHGWGFDRRLWDGVRMRLGLEHRVEVVDLGFFGEPRMPEPDPDEPVVAVGHSLGACWWLAQASIPWRRLLSINGFPRFTECAGYAPAAASRVLARMQARFAGEPQQVLAEFHARCGAVGPAVAAAADIARLAQGLQWLHDWDGRAMLAQRTGEVYALAGRHDPIVPPQMAQMAFAALPAGHLRWSDAPGHVLPLTAPDACARWIEAHLA